MPSFGHSAPHLVNATKPGYSASTYSSVLPCATLMKRFAVLFDLQRKQPAGERLEPPAGLALFNAQDLQAAEAVGRSAKHTGRMVKMRGQFAGGIFKRAHIGGNFHDACFRICFFIQILSSIGMPFLRKNSRWSFDQLVDGFGFFLHVKRAAAAAADGRAFAGAGLYSCDGKTRHRAALLCTFSGVSRETGVSKLSICSYNRIGVRKTRMIR